MTSPVEAADCVATNVANTNLQLLLRIREVTPKVWFLIALLLLCVVPPLFVLTWTSIHQIEANGSYGQLSSHNYLGLASGQDFYRSLFNAALYSFGAALTAIVIGAVQAWLAERTDAPMRQVLYLTSIISLGVPYVLYIVSWILFLGKNGPVNTLLRSWFGGTGAYIDVYSLGGMIFIEGMLWAPLAFLLLSSVFRNADASYEEAAAVCGASVPSTVRHITLGMARPAMFALAVLIFVRASESFEVPALVGLPNGVVVLTTSIYQKLQHSIPSDVGGAAAFGCFLLLLMAILLKLYGRISAEAHKYRTITGKGFRARVVRLGPWKPVAGVFVLIVPIVTIVIPVMMLLWTALLPYYQLFSVKALSSLSLHTFVLVLESGPYREAMANSLILASVTATVVVGCTAFAGWCVGRRISGSGVIDFLAAVPLAFPALVLGFAFLQIYLNVTPWLYGTLSSLIIVSVIAFFPYGMRYAQLGVIQIHPELEEAAALSGARVGTTFIRIILPLLLPAIISSWLFVFLLAARAMSLVLLLAGADSPVVAVSLFDLWSNGQLNELAALGCVWTAIMTCFSMLFYLVARRFQLAVT